eukprot:265122_1
MAQTLTPNYLLYSGRNENGDNHIDELLTDIGADISIMKKIIQNIGTTSDTTEERRKFNALRNDVNQKIAKATRKISRSMSRDDTVDRNDNKFDTQKYQIELSKYTDSLRTLVQTALHQFRNYQPQTMMESHEKSPLLQSQNKQIEQQQLLLSSSAFAKDVKLYDETKAIEQEEETMTDIRGKLVDMKEMFVDLDDMVRQQEEVVTMLESKIDVARDHIDKGAEHTEQA